MTTTIHTTSEAGRVPEVVVQSYQIIGTAIRVYEACAYANGRAWEQYSTTTTINGRTYGRMGTERCPAEIEAMVGGSPERIEAAARFHRSIYEAAYAVIVEAAPEAANGRRSMGEIVVVQS